jgi:Cu-Zn family superoxide dismutase
MKNLYVIIFAMIMVMGIGQGALQAGSLMPKKEAVVEFQSTSMQSDVLGKATLKETSDGLSIDVALTGVPEGAHGFHIHQNGSCADQGNAAGGHFDPDHVQHGELMKDGFAHAHAGDFGNIVANKEGVANLKLTLPKLNLSTTDQYGVAGRAIILHEKADNFGQPTGDAGGRIACGIIQED